MVKTLLLIIMALIAGWFLGSGYTKLLLKNRLVDIRHAELAAEGNRTSDPLESLNADLSEIAKEKQLLRKFLDVSTRYMKEKDYEGLERWLDKTSKTLSSME